MIKILSGADVSVLDKEHILYKGISSLELMEKAATGFVDWWLQTGFTSEGPIAIFCGGGNNGGDGLAIARLLVKSGCAVSVFTCFDSSSTLSPDCQKNLELLPGIVRIFHWTEFHPAHFSFLIDAFLGAGFKGALRDEARKIISLMNSFKGKIFAVDIPSGLPSDHILSGDAVKAEVTVTFAFPKLALLFPEHAEYTGQLVLIDIGIGDKEYESFKSDFFYLQKKDVPGFHKKFHRFSHKGDFGKVLLIAGNKGKMGAAVLASKSALRTGSGLVTCLVPESERLVIHSAVPEAMCVFEEFLDFSSYDSIGIGPGFGLDRIGVLERVFSTYPKPVVLDADGLNILSRRDDLIPSIPKGSILTPHLGEFERLFGRHSSHLERLEKARNFCVRFGLNLLIKGANSVICLADGRQIFNSSGSQYMATAGMGDVLTGMLTSFLGQGYTPEQALMCGVFQHGLAGEIVGGQKLRSTIAGDLIEAIPETFKELGVF